MRNPFFHGVGGVLSADIAVPDHERELRFYSQVLTTGSAPLWRDDLTNNQGTPIIGLGVRTPEYESLPLQWMPHFQVADVAASAARTLELGGQELFHGKGENAESQWAVLTDPAGAAFGLIPVVADEATGAEHPDTIGRIAGLSLAVADADAEQMCEFYGRVIGWSTIAVDAEGRREMGRSDGVVAAEISPLPPGNQRVPSVWIISLPVGDFDESLRQVREGGGEIVEEENGHAVVRDPVGVYIALQGTRR